MSERRRESVLQSARAKSDCMRRPPGHLITGAGREEVMRKGGALPLRLNLKASNVPFGVGPVKFIPVAFGPAM